MRQYLVPQGYVWDQVSYLLYKDEGLVHLLLAANPALRRIVMFEEATTINVPDRPKAKPASPSTLPPWKR